MGEHSDEWAAKAVPNLWSTVPQVSEMQSEGGAAGAVHALSRRARWATTFTASQGLLLMIPNMFKIAGELTPFVMHVSAAPLQRMRCRSSAITRRHGLPLDRIRHAGCRFGPGGPGLCRDRPRSHAQDAHTFLHFFDGFRTSHEVAKIAVLSDEDLRSLVDEEAIAAHRRRALSPDHPVLRGTAQNPDVFFQAREACNTFYDACPEAVTGEMKRFAQVTGRHYRLFDYVGHPEAERVIIMMGSGAETAHELVDWMVARGEKVGLLKVRLFRPFATGDFIKAIPRSARAIAVLDRTKEPGAIGDPLYLDVVAALRDAEEDGAGKARPRVIGGRYGLSSKEFTPAMVHAVFDELSGKKPRRRFTVGIVDDVTGLSCRSILPSTSSPRTWCARFFTDWGRRDCRREQEFDQDHR